MDKSAPCPVCGHPNDSATTQNATVACAQCGAMLDLLEIAAPQARQVAQPPSKEGDDRSSSGSSALLDFATAVLPRAALAAVGCAVAGALVTVMLAPMFGSNLRIALFGAAFFGAQIGLIFGFLWFGLEQVQSNPLTGGLLGLAIGVVIGAINIIALYQSAYLPEVSLLEGFLLGAAAGPITGIFVALYRDPD